MKVWMICLRSPRNMCSVRHRPMPCAPKSRDSCASSGLSAFARTPKRAELVGPLQDGVQVAGQLGKHQLNGAQHHDAGGAVDARSCRLRLMTTSVPATTASFFSASIFSASTPHTHGAPMPRAITAAWDVLPPWRGEDALGGDHAGQVVGRWSPSARARTCGPPRRRPRRRRRRTRPRPPRRPGSRSGRGRARRSAAFLSNCGCSSWSSCSGSTRMHGLFLGDEAFLLHLDGDVQRGGGGALAHAGLQHPQLALLDGELDVAHVAEVVLQHDEDLFELAGRPPPGPRRVFSSAMGLVLRMPATTSSPWAFTR